MPSRPSREQRAAERAARELIRRTDRSGRTRSAAALRAWTEALDEAGPDIGANRRQLVHHLRMQARRKPRMAGVQKIWNGTTRPNFDDSILRDFRAALPTPCSICGNDIVKGAKGGDALSIDHQQEWSQVQAGIAPRTVCDGTIHWSVIYYSDVKEAYNDRRNLAPSHKSCNSSKGGQRGIDANPPTSLGACPTPAQGCELTTCR